MIMKKNFFTAIVLSSSAFLAGCGLGTTGTTGALPAANNTQTSVLTSAGTSVLGTLMSTLLGNTTTKSSIVGTWTYASPKVAFESQNILAQLGSAVASSKIESTLDKQLKKLGFQAGKSTLTFNNDGSCALLRNGKSFPGTYTYDTSSSQMTITGAFGMTTIKPTVSVMGNELYMMFEADKLMNIMNVLANATSYTSTLSSLLGNYNGLKLGMTMTK